MDKERNAPWMSVPQFGDWDQKGNLPDYSMDFSKIREMRKQNKRDPSRASLGNEEEFSAQPDSHSQLNQQPHHDDKQHSPIVSILYTLTS
ncbi:hypothetical protein IFM89_038678 [Coptis chinensis]|uniref:RIN4 pathogenic type III effector avirulence factor Avr cleavage site domain-containing protein n=1 Tax=Coptis chinensis TaxID=261450 RepID=A0A835I6R2_9MAGN|nr:hypothetical protein IFM89_038678 [Coptis chinensis]